jgi:predicted ABC-type exoprotein transport system permease subunit
MQSTYIVNSKLWVLLIYPVHFGTLVIASVYAVWALINGQAIQPGISLVFTLCSIVRSLRTLLRRASRIFAVHDTENCGARTELIPLWTAVPRDIGCRLYSFQTTSE